MVYIPPALAPKPHNSVFPSWSLASLGLDGIPQEFSKKACNAGLGWLLLKERRAVFVFDKAGSRVVIRVELEEFGFALCWESSTLERWHHPSAAGEEDSTQGPWRLFLQLLPLSHTTRFFPVCPWHPSSLYPLPEPKVSACDCEFVCQYLDFSFNIKPRSHPKM